MRAIHGMRKPFPFRLRYYNNPRQNLEIIGRASLQNRISPLSREWDSTRIYTCTDFVRTRTYLLIVYSLTNLRNGLPFSRYRRKSNITLISRRTCFIRENRLLKQCSSYIVSTCRPGYVGLNPRKMCATTMVRLSIQLHNGPRAGSRLEPTRSAGSRGIGEKRTFSERRIRVCMACFASAHRKLIVEYLQGNDGNCCSLISMGFVHKMESNVRYVRPLYAPICTANSQNFMELNHYTRSPVPIRRRRSETNEKKNKIKVSSKRHC